MATVTMETMVHIRFQGRSWDVAEATLGLAPNCSDSDVRQAVARYLDVGAKALGDYVVEREPSGHLTVRPLAVFG